MQASYVSGDPVGETSGGLLAQHEIRALEEVFGGVVVLDGKELSPARRHQPDSVFLYDYFALARVRDMKLDHAHFYSGTFSHTVAHLKARGVTVSYCVPAHDRRVTVEEFHRLGLEYPFHHISDDNLWAIFSRGYREADLVIAQSELSARFLREEGCRNVKVIYGGCDMPLEVAPFPERFDVGYLGQTGPDKGLLYLLQGWAKLNYPDSWLLLAGRSTEDLAPMIQGTVNAGRYSLMGFVGRPSDLYNRCWVYIQPSVCEAFGLEVVEAMAHGRAVVVSQGAGACELVEDGVEGFVVPIRDPGAIAEKIDWLRQNPDRCREMGARARGKAMHYTWGRVEERYREAFKELVGEQGLL